MNFKTWQILAIVICIILGVILHFTYEWSGENVIVGLFSPINESTWEHLKLIFYPMVIMALIGYNIVKERSVNYWLAQTIGIIIAIIFTIVFFYTYSGIIGTNFAWLNIATFVISIILGEFITYKIFVSKKLYNAELVSIIFLVVLFLNFILYTFIPPNIVLFEDPINKSYGI